MIFGIKDYALAGLAIVLGLSLWGNYHLSGKVDEANRQIGAAQSDANNAKEVAGECSKSVTRLEEDQREREAKAAPVVQASKDEDKKQQSKAQVILITPPTEPGNDCQSARDRASTWLKGNTK